MTPHRRKSIAKRRLRYKKSKILVEYQCPKCGLTTSTDMSDKDPCEGCGTPNSKLVLLSRSS